MMRRRVTLIPRVVSGIERGREVIVDGTPVVGIPAARRVAETAEDEDRRDVQSTRFDYMLAALHPDTGEALVISGRDRIVDGDEVLEVVGDARPAVQHGRGRTHHLEVRAMKIDAGERPGS